MEASAAAAMGSEPESPAILIVDDTPHNIGLLSAMLRPLGSRLHAASSGAQALRIAREIRPDLILLDVMMPAMDGFASCRALKNDPRCAEVPVIFITACTDGDDVVRGFQAGASDYLAKPIRVEELLARVQIQLQLRRYALAAQASQQACQSLSPEQALGLAWLHSPMADP